MFIVVDIRVLAAPSLRLLGNPCGKACLHDLLIIANGAKLRHIVIVLLLHIVGDKAACPLLVWIIIGLPVSLSINVLHVRCG